MYRKTMNEWSVDVYIHRQSLYVITSSMHVSCTVLLL
jgi:hypothetical protein